LHLPTLAHDEDTIVPELVRCVMCELQRVRGLQVRLVAPAFDARGEPDLVQKLGELVCGGVDHLEVPLLRLADDAQADEGLSEPVDGGQRRAEVVRRQRHELREG